MLDLESSLLALVVNQWPHYITSWRAGMDIQICVHMDGNELCILVSPLFDYHVSTIQSQFLVQTAFAWNKLAVIVRTRQIKREEELNKTASSSADSVTQVSSEDMQAMHENQGDIKDRVWLCANFWCCLWCMNSFPVPHWSQFIHWRGQQKKTGLKESHWEWSLTLRFPLLYTVACFKIILV